MIIIAAALTLLPTLARAQESPSTSVSAVGDLASLLEGEFTTQPSPADATGTPPAGPVYYELAKRVDVPALSHDAVYSELRQGGPDGRIVRQRLYALKLDDSGAIAMTAYSFANGAELAGADADRTPLAKLAPADLRPEGCTLDWRSTGNGFEGSMRPLSCPAAPAKSSADSTPVMQVSKTGLALPVDADSGRTPTMFRRLR
jgi:hypothetical protein